MFRDSFSSNSCSCEFPSQKFWIFFYRFFRSRKFHSGSKFFSAHWSRLWTLPFYGFQGCRGIHEIENLVSSQVWILPWNSPHPGNSLSRQVRISIFLGIWIYPPRTENLYLWFEFPLDFCFWARVGSKNRKFSTVYPHLKLKMSSIFHKFWWGGPVRTVLPTRICGTDNFQGF